MTYGSEVWTGLNGDSLFSYYDDWDSGKLVQMAGYGWDGWTRSYVLDS